ncbi:glycoside hydrolase [Aliishimia ponticola]|uniref:Glycoside hydrolase n=1 Tax=Aliishimia ponticola TaxID=2499833 RepID=A0A4S4NDG6_9RHOB|nr:GH25 family lysozyme [Aliishimia ponticola]THH36088.1 glycoside hydrolase [Aliishimia ponticola]
MRRAFLLICLLILSACGAPSSDPGGRTTIGDRDPVNFRGRAPSSFAVRGIDVARFQKKVDWARARKAGVEFAFIKATEGGDLRDPMFRTHWRGAQRAGVRRGAYHFYYFCTPPEVQARWFIRTVPKTAGALPPVLDMEWNPFSPTCQRRPTGQIVRGEMRVFLEMVERHYGQKPIIYTTPGFYDDAGLGAFSDYEFWLRTTAKTPREAYPGQSWRFWQYTATGILPGTPGDVDINVFNGSRDFWESWLSQRAR